VLDVAQPIGGRLGERDGARGPDRSERLTATSVGQDVVERMLSAARWADRYDLAELLVDERAEALGRVGLRRSDPARVEADAERALVEISDGRCRGWSCSVRGVRCRVARSARGS
jgi:hypothetical protein